MQKGRYVTHIVRDGDTIQSIGTLYNVDWTEIATMNGLNYPYVVAELFDDIYRYRNDIAHIGTKLTIPNNQTIPVKSKDVTDSDEIYAYGCDLEIYSYDASPLGNVNLENEGHITDNGNGDLKITKGIRNLSQQIITRLGTEKGSLMLHPEYGSDLLKYIGKTITQELLIDIKLEVIETIMSDFRVKGVGQVDVYFTNTSVRVEAEIFPIDTSTSPFLLGANFDK